MMCQNQLPKACQDAKCRQVPSAKCQGKSRGKTARTYEYVLRHSYVRRVRVALAVTRIMTFDAT